MYIKRGGVAAFHIVCIRYTWRASECASF